MYYSNHVQFHRSLPCKGLNHEYITAHGVRKLQYLVQIYPPFNVIRKICYHNFMYLLELQKSKCIFANENQSTNRNF